MSIKDLVKTKETKEIVIYTSKVGTCSSKGGLIPKAGEIFLNPCPEDVELLEYLVSCGIVEKITKTEEN